MSDSLKLCAGAWGFRLVEIPAYLDACAKLGFRFAEMNLTNAKGTKHLSSSPVPKDLKAMAQAEKASGVKIVCFCVGNDFTNPDPEKVERDVAQVKSWIDLASESGVETLRLFAGFSSFESLQNKSYEQCAAKLAEVGAYGQEKNVLIVVENHGGPAATGAQVKRILELANHSNVKANYDGGNFAYYKEDPLAAYQVLRGQIGYTHWKDVQFKEGKPYYCALGDGITDWRPVVQALLKDGFDGYWAMEYEEPNDVEAGMRKCIKVVQEATLKA